MLLGGFLSKALVGLSMHRFISILEHWQATWKVYNEAPTREIALRYNRSAGLGDSEVKQSLEPVDKIVVASVVDFSCFYAGAWPGYTTRHIHQWWWGRYSSQAIPHNHGVFYYVLFLSVWLAALLSVLLLKWLLSYDSHSKVRVLWALSRATGN